MSLDARAALPTNARLWRATGAALLTAAAILVVAVLPAEYGIDPTGLGRRLGLLTLSQAAGQPAAASEATSPDAALAARAAAVFGANAGQTFAPAAVRQGTGAVRTDTLTVTLPPGEGAEVKATLKAGEGFVFQWRSTGALAVDMHGERPDAKDAYTSYAIEAEQREASGSFTAPFDGQHGWYFLNRGTAAVTVDVRVTGFHTALVRPGHAP